jgi:hypothetical protein
MLPLIMSLENASAKTSTTPRWIQALAYVAAKTPIMPRWALIASVIVPIPMLILIHLAYANVKMNGHPSTQEQASVGVTIPTLKF